MGSLIARWPTDLTTASPGLARARPIIRPLARPRPEHEAAARLLTIAAGMAPLLGEPSLTLVRPEGLATLLSNGLAAG